MGRMPRFKPIVGISLILAWMAGLASCSSPVVRSQSPDSEIDEPSETRVIGDMARPWGLRLQTIEGIGVVTNLDNTGSDPPATNRRRMLIDDMKRRGVNDPNTFLALPTTSLVIIRTNLPPGIQKGDRLDIQVMTPSRSSTESLRNGWLMQARLQELAVLGNRIRSGEPLAVAAGAVVVDSLLETESNVSETRGRILGGGMATKSRPLGLILKSENHSVRASAMIGEAINRRFHTFDRGIKRGVATPKRDSFIELAVQSQYRDNLVRYFRVIQAIALNESPAELIDRLSRMEQELLNPRTALAAAVQLEAVGPEALPVLRVGLNSDSSIVRFAAAEALAYMDQEDAIAPLVDAARHESAFRWHAITALGSMLSSDSREALSELLHETSDETRYGAFQAIMNSNPRDPIVQGELLADTMTLHEVPSAAKPLVHIRRTERPEVTLFGSEIHLTTPSVIFAGKRIMAKSEGSKRFKVSRFDVGKDDTVVYCSDRLSDLIRTIVKVGGSYTDVVAAITNAKQTGTLTARVKFDALPKTGRKYNWEEDPPLDEEADRVGSGSSESGDTESGDTESGDTESGDTESGDTGSGASEDENDSLSDIADS